MKTPHDVLRRRFEIARDTLEYRKHLEDWKGCIEREAVLRELDYLWQQFVLEGYCPVSKEEGKI